MEVLKPKDVLKILKISSSTLRKWDKEGKLNARRNERDRRCYTKKI